MALDKAAIAKDFKKDIDDFIRIYKKDYVKNINESSICDGMFDALMKIFKKYCKSNVFKSSETTRRLNEYIKHVANMKKYHKNNKESHKYSDELFKLKKELEKDVKKPADNRNPNALINHTEAHDGLANILNWLTIAEQETTRY